MRNFKMILVVVVPLIFAIMLSGCWESGIGNITDIAHKKGISVVAAKGYANEDNMFLNFSYKCGDKRSGSMAWVKGSFDQEFVMKPCSRGYSKIQFCLGQEVDGKGRLVLVNGRAVCLDYLSD